MTRSSRSAAYLWQLYMSSPKRSGIACIELTKNHILVELKTFTLYVKNIHLPFFITQSGNRFSGTDGCDGLILLLISAKHKLFKFVDCTVLNINYYYYLHF